MALDCPALSLISDGSEVLPDQPKGGRIAPSIWPNYSDRVAELLRNPGRVAPKNAIEYDEESGTAREVVLKD